MKWFHFLLPVAILGFIPLLCVAQGQTEPQDPDTPSGKILQEADKKLAANNYMEARGLYDQARDLAVAGPGWSSLEAKLAVEGAVNCDMRLSLWDDPLDRVKSYISSNKGNLQEARGERYLASLYLQIPHYGTKQGGVYHRGEYLQGVQVSSFKKDRKEAISHDERARELASALAVGNTLAFTDEKSPVREQIGIDFELVAAIVQHEEYYGYQNPFWGWWWGYWSGGLDAEDDSAAVDEADYEQPRRWNYQQQQSPPTGVPVDEHGSPRFIGVPNGYNAQLGDGAKIRFLLNEIETLDASSDKEFAAQALLQNAKICATLYGPSGMGQDAVEYNRFGRPLPKRDVNADGLSKKIWELADDEAITLVSGKNQLIQLPADESPMALFEAVMTKYPQSPSAPAALFDKASYYQARQQFPAALEAYQRLKSIFPKSQEATSADGEISQIKEPGVIFEQTPVFTATSQPKVKFSYRNLGEVSFTIHKFNLEEMVRDGLKDRDYQEYSRVFGLNYLLSQQENNWKQYVGDKVSDWTQQVPTNDGNLTAEAVAETKLTTPGIYVLEAKGPGASASTSVFVVVSSTAIVMKEVQKGGLIWVVDSTTGQPLADQPITIIETWEEWNNPHKQNEMKVIETDLRTDENGALVYKRKQTQFGSNIAAELHRGPEYVFSMVNGGFNENNPNSFENGQREYVITDRPVYRPGSVVKFRIWRRDRDGGIYAAPQKGGIIWVGINNPKGDQVFTKNLDCDDQECASGEFTLTADSALGLYSINAGNAGGGQFRVEEYKKPEFEVKVVPAKTQARLGDKVTAKITATYYFGAPVSKGTVKYKVFREEYHYVYWGADEYDWLYGSGYGRCYYGYPWFTWWHRWGGFIIWDPWLWDGWYGPGGTGMGADDEEMARRTEESGTRHALRDLVAQGEAELKPDGTYDLEIDTAPALKTMGDRDHRYTIEAEVRDASRRTITGQGDIKVTRQEFYGFCEVDRGWYRPQEDAKIDIRTLTPDSVPVATNGTVTISRIVYDQGVTVPKETVVKTMPGETDVDGRLSFTYEIPEEGQYRISYSTHDSTNQEVQANAVFWAWGPHFDGSVYRFNNLEIITDKRTYQPGDTAHLLINTADNNSKVLFSDNASQGILWSYKFLDLPQRSTVVDVPITEASKPNFFVEATVIRNGHVHNESRELFVPPAKEVLQVKVTSDRDVYRPGDVGHVHVAVTDSLGNPVQGSVTLTGYDKAVTYIQDEFGPSPKTYFYGQQRIHSPNQTTNLDDIFSAIGTIQNPEQVQNYFWDDSYGYEERRGFLARHEVSKMAFGSALDKNGNDTLGSDTLDYLHNSAAASPQGGVIRGMGFLPPGSEPMGQKVLGVIAGKDQDQAPMADPDHPAIRQNFADTAVWSPELKTGANGQVDADVTFPDSLTTWRLHAYSITDSTQVGDGMGEVVTAKKLLVRLESPRFFVERDEVVLSSNVHNYLNSTKSVKAELIVPGAQFEALDSTSAQTDSDGNLHLTATADIAANGEHRFDWPLKVKAPGQVHVTTKALTDEESDAMELTFPVLVHGANKTIAVNGSYHVGDNGSRDIAQDLPEQIDPEQTKLEVTLSPSLAGVMIDALPYLVGYPYGCTEQTMDRFYPAILVKHTLQSMGTDLETVGKQRKQMNAQDVKNRFKQSDVDPVFDSDELNHILEASLSRLKSFQHGDGGWGWWAEDDSSPYQTAYVLQGLVAAKDAGVLPDENMLTQGRNYLANDLEAELQKPKDKQDLPDLVEQSYWAYILTLSGDDPSELRKKWMDDLYEHRGEINQYGQALLGLTFHLRNQDDRAKMLVENILQFLQKDDTNETAWVRTPESGWWFWWNNDIETNAWVLKALVEIDPKSDVSPRLVKWLINNRKNGYYWRSTRDTAQVIGAMADYMKASGEGNPDYDLTVKIDGEEVKKVHVNKDNFFTFDNRVVLYGLQVKPGHHTITLEKTGSGALYYSTYLSYFTKEDDIKGAGNEIEIQRTYYKLTQKTEQVVIPNNGNPPAAQGQPDAATGHTEVRDEWDRTELKNGDAVKSGDMVEVVLKIHAKNTYDYLAFEDMKPAGCEPVDLRSGGKFAGGLCPNVELRDTKTVFFIGLLEQGDHILRYKLRAETPGTFHALPTSGYAMYAPEVKAISDEMRLKIEDDGGGK